MLVVLLLVPVPQYRRATTIPAGHPHPTSQESPPTDTGEHFSTNPTRRIVTDMSEARRPPVRSESSVSLKKVIDASWLAVVH